MQSVVLSMRLTAALKHMQDTHTFTVILTYCADTRRFIQMLEEEGFTLTDLSSIEDGLRNMAQTATRVQEINKTAEDNYFLVRGLAFCASLIGHTHGECVFAHTV